MDKRRGRSERYYDFFIETKKPVKVRVKAVYIKEAKQKAFKILKARLNQTQLAMTNYKEYMILGDMLQEAENAQRKSNN